MPPALMQKGFAGWDLKTVEAEPRQPAILASAEDARTILLHLPAGGELQEHEVPSGRGWSSSTARSTSPRPRWRDGAGEGRSLFEFDPGERRTIAARSDARLLLILSPWPGDGHPGAMTLAEKAEARERAAEHGPL